MLIAEILKDKGADVFTASPSQPLADTVQSLHDRRIGALVVCEGDRVVGILSERDLVRAIVTDGAESLGQPISTYMSQDVVFAAPGETVDVLMERMTDRRIRHLPVLQDQRLIGVVSIGDLVKCKIAEATFEADSMNAYIGAG